MSVGRTDPVALLRAQFAEAQQSNAAFSSMIAQRAAATLNDVRNGVAFLAAHARAGDPERQRQLKDFFEVLDDARAAATSKIVVPGAQPRPPVVVQSGGGKVVDDGAPAEVGECPVTPNSRSCALRA